MNMSNYSNFHQEYQYFDGVLDGLDGEDMCHQNLCNNCMMKQFSEEGSHYYWILKQCIQYLFNMFPLGSDKGEQVTEPTNILGGMSGVSH